MTTMTHGEKVLTTYSGQNTDRRPLHPLIRGRWSPRRFRERGVEPAKLRSLLEAARSAPSSYNEQPWAFLVATAEEPAEHDRMLECLVPGNREWAQGAPVLLIGLAKTTFDLDGRENAHARHDLGLAAAHLTFQASALGLSVHQMGGIRRDAIVERYGVPEGWEPVTATAVGYADEEAPAERERKPLESFVFGGAWGEPAGIEVRSTADRGRP